MPVRSHWPSGCHTGRRNSGVTLRLPRSAPGACPLAGPEPASRSAGLSCTVAILSPHKPSLRHPRTGELSSTFPRSEPGRCRQSRATKRGEGRSAPCSPRWVGVRRRLQPTAPRAQPVGGRHPLSPSRTRADVPGHPVGRPGELAGSSTQPQFGLPEPEATLMGRFRRFGTRVGHPDRSYCGPWRPPSSRRLESQVGRP